jgi:superfamily II DNA helicase RecQ
MSMQSNKNSKQARIAVGLVLREEEIRHILHAADSLIGVGGRTMLAKILKGSRDKKLLELELNVNVAYGYYSSLTIEQITERIDWTIKNEFLELEYQRDMPTLVFTERGWNIQRDQAADLLLLEWTQWIQERAHHKDMTYLKDRNRGMILLFLQKIAATADKRFIPLLEQWSLVDYQKVKKAIHEVIVHMQNKSNSLLVLEGAPQTNVSSDLILHPRSAERIKCWECGKRFDWTVEEQDFFRMRGWEPPKRCDSCREERRRLRDGFAYLDTDWF